VKVRIDATATSEEFAALRAEVATIRSEAATLETSQAELATSTYAIVDRLDALEAQVRTQTSQAGLATAAQAIMDQLNEPQAEDPTRAFQADLVAATHAVGHRLDALESQLRTQAASASDAAAAQQVRVDETRTMIQDIRSDLDAISHQQRLVARQVSLLQYGPGDPQKPCLAGEHRGFSLVHYQGRVYGLRKPLEPDEAQLTELLACNSPRDLIAGHSMDGVRARIDAAEDARELHAEMACLDQELLAIDSRLSEALRQVNATLQANARDLLRLARSWPNRFLKIFKIGT
jgi:hypothetical protein